MVPELLNTATQWVEESIAAKQAILNDAALMEGLVDAARRCAHACQEGNKVLFTGNGGSAADAQHMAGEFVSRFNYDRPGLTAFALTVDSSVMTAIGNDYGYERLFERQIQACAKPGDVLIALSTSGNSPNILHGLRRASEMGVTTVGFTGASGGRMADLCDICLCAPSLSTPRIQECHITLGHVLCGLVEQIVFPREKVAT